MSNAARLAARLLLTTVFAAGPLISTALANNATSESSDTGRIPLATSKHNPPRPPLNAPDTPAAAPESTSPRYMTAKPVDSSTVNRRALRRHHHTHPANAAPAG